MAAGAEWGNTQRAGKQMNSHLRSAQFLALAFSRRKILLSGTSQQAVGNFCARVLSWPVLGKFSWLGTGVRHHS